MKVTAQKALGGTQYEVTNLAFYGEVDSTHWQVVGQLKSPANSQKVAILGNYISEESASEICITIRNRPDASEYSMPEDPGRHQYYTFSNGCISWWNKTLRQYIYE